MKKRGTRREAFLDKVDGPIPGHRLDEPIDSFHPKPGPGRRPYAPGVMLRVHRVQLLCNLGDPGTEALPYEVELARRLVGVRRSAAPLDETTNLSFRSLWVSGNAAHQGADKREESPSAEVDGPVAMKTGRRQRMDKAGAQEVAQRRKAPVRAKAEHPYLDV